MVYKLKTWLLHSVLQICDIVMIPYFEKTVHISTQVGRKPDQRSQEGNHFLVCRLSGHCQKNRVIRKPVQSQYI